MEETSLSVGLEQTIPSSPGSHINSVTVRGNGKGGRAARDDEQRPLLSQKIAERERANKGKLSMILGVTLPCCLSIFSVVLFLRLGFVLGQSGYLQTILIVVLGYFVVILTVLSISAISTSATVEGGGVYCILMPIHVTIIF
jgi:potassium/chloride transporter 9